MPAVFLVMAGALSVSSFACGMIPLSATYSKKYLDIFNALSTGLLLGTALGVIIPEGIETMVDYYKDSDSLTFKIAIELIFGFLLMMVVEQLVSRGLHAHSMPNGTIWNSDSHSRSNGNVHLEFDAELGDLESDRGGQSARRSSETSRHSPSQAIVAARERAISFTFGLIVHGLADGFALGVSAVEEASSEQSSNLSLIVFFALLFHKAPTSVAFAVSLLNSSLPRADCKKYLGVFAASTPAGALATYFLLSFLEANNSTNTAGSALLISGGTFLYVATVLQPVSQHQSEPLELKSEWRMCLVIIGTLTPLILSTIIGHGH